MPNHLKLSCLALGLSLTASIIATAPASAQSKKQEPQIAGGISTSCLGTLGPLSGGTPPSAVIDGTALKDAKAIRSMRAKAKDGRTLIIRGGNFSGAKFGDDNFSNICFVGTTLLNTRWVKTNAQGIGFVDADLTGSSFDRVSMPNALFRNTILANVDASGAQLSNGQLDGGWDPSMANLKLDNAIMNGFRFVCGTTSADGCPFDRKQLSLRGANLTGASLASFSIWDAKIDDAILANTEVGFDQIMQFSVADIRGPVIVRAQQKSIALSPEAFRIAAAALQSGGAVYDTECNTPTEPVTQLFCQAGRADLRAYRDDIERLYQASRPAAGATSGKSSGSMITVTAANAAQDKYWKSLRRCALKAEAKAFACIAMAMDKRRALLIAQLVKSSPLEADARALFVSAKAPMVQLVAKDTRLASLSPLLVDGTSPVLLAYRDEDQALQARGIGQRADGQQCMANFTMPAATAKSSKRKKKAPAPGFTAWMSGAEFVIGTPLKAKKQKRKKKKGAAVAAAVQPAPVSGCGNIVINSGPLVRLPISENEFDKLWTSQLLRSQVPTS